jgi:hypothetical protein
MNVPSVKPSRRVFLQRIQASLKINGRTQTLSDTKILVYKCTETGQLTKSFAYLRLAGSLSPVEIEGKHPLIPQRRIVKPG